MNKKLPEGFPFVLKDDEEIKQIKEFPDYWISNYGRVFSYKKNRKVIWKELNCKRNKKNEKLVVLSNNKIYKSFTLARLVFEYFCEEIKAKHVIIFKDGDNTNYYYKNLKQISKLQAMIESRDEGLMKDIDLLSELSFNLRHGKAKIVEVKND